MKKTFKKPVIRVFHINTAAILAGSGDEPMVTSTQSEENAEGLSKGSLIGFGFDD